MAVGLHLRVAAARKCDVAAQAAGGKSGHLNVSSSLVGGLPTASLEHKLSGPAIFDLHPDVQFISSHVSLNSPFCDCLPAL
jgi:hypothetical protein